jgi:tetratricopeptide (TPR) repeat protein
MGRAEGAIRKLLARPSAPANQAPELARTRPLLLSAAVQELATICLHESMGRAEEGLKLLNQASQDLPPNDPKLARIWGTQIQAHLALGQLESAVTVLDALYDRFPDNPTLATACKSVAVRLHRSVSEELEKKGDEKKIADGLRRMSKYYTKWLALAPTLGMPVTVDDVATVAAQLYQAAKRLNGMDDSVLSFLDIKGRPVAFPQYWEDAAFVTTILLEKASLKPEERLQVMGRLARCRSFLAKDQVGWDKAKEAYDRIIKESKVIDASGRVDVSVATKQKGLLGLYVELGQVYVALGRLGQKFQYDNAVGVFSNVILATAPESEAWWNAKYMVLSSLFERGTGDDLKQARVGLDNLERNHPEFDAGKYGLKEKLLELKQKLHQVGGGGR